MVVKGLKGTWGNLRFQPTKRGLAYFRLLGGTGLKFLLVFEDPAGDQREIVGGGGFGRRMAARWRV